jgi:hypothetical protein
MPSCALASVRLRNVRHLWLAASSGQAFAAACAAIMASDNGRRPKGVVGWVWDMAVPVVRQQKRVRRIGATLDRLCRI